MTVLKDRVTTALGRDRTPGLWIAGVVLGIGAVLAVVAAVWAYGQLRPVEAATSSTAGGQYGAPEQTVTAYYTAVLADNRTAGASLVAPAAQPLLLDSPMTDFGNVVSLKNFAVKPAITPRPTPTTTASAASVPTVEVPVTFVVVFRNQITGNDGPQAVWVVLQRTSATSGPWQVLAIRNRP